MQQRAAQVLLVMDKGPFLEELKESIDQKDGEIFHFEDVNEAKDVLSDPLSKLNALFIDPQFVPNHWIELIKLTHLNHCSIPIYLTYEEAESILGDIKISEIGVRDIIAKSDEAFHIIKNITYNLRQFNQSEALAAKSNKDESEIIDSDLVAISAENFLSGHQSFFDVYIKLRQDKFVKILSAGDGFNPERLNSYLEKGLQFLYIHKEAQKYYLDFCDKLTHKIIQSKSIATDVKVAQTLNQGQEVVSFLKENGLDSESLQFCQNFAVNTFHMVSQLKSDNKNVGKILGMITNFEHTAGTALLAGLVARKYGILGQELHETLALAASLHDIGLSKMQDMFTHDPNHKLYDEDLIELEMQSDSCPTARKKELETAFYQHHEWGADMIQMIDNIPPLVGQIVFQHHMRTDGTGFPILQKNQMITPHAQILGVADEYAKLIKLITSGKKDKKDLALFPQKLNGFSGKVSRAFTQVFFK